MRNRGSKCLCDPKTLAAYIEAKLLCYPGFFSIFTRKCVLPPAGHSLLSHGKKVIFQSCRWAALVVLSAMAWT
eukprot:scaffold298026_cov15-Tisochrysis_lutea.AAC.1